MEVRYYVKTDDEFQFDLVVGCTGVARAILFDLRIAAAIADGAG